MKPRLVKATILFNIIFFHILAYGVQAPTPKFKIGDFVTTSGKKGTNGRDEPYYRKDGKNIICPEMKKGLRGVVIGKQRRWYLVFFPGKRKVTSISFLYLLNTSLYVVNI